MKYNIRKASILDLDKIFELQNDYNHTLLTKSALQEDLTSSLALYFIAIDSSNNIIGAIGSSLLVDHVDISMVITKKDLLCNGVATTLLKTLIEYCRNTNIENIFLEVRESNIAAINLYEKFNFTKISTRKNYYTDNMEDALIYMLKI